MRRTRRFRSGPVSLMIVFAVVLGTLMPFLPAGTVAEEGDVSQAEHPAVETAEAITESTETPVDATEIPDEPTSEPTDAPANPTDVPAEPTGEPTDVPVDPTDGPTSEPTIEPTGEPAEPTVAPTEDQPTEAPAVSQRIATMAIEPTATITKTASTTTPNPGELVRITIEVSGQAEAGVGFRIIDTYDLPRLTLGNQQVSNLLNVTDPVLEYATDSNESQWNYVTFATVDAGNFALTFTYEATVATDASGVVDGYAAIVGPAGQYDLDWENLTVTSGPIETTGTITKTASNTTPAPGETLTFTITVTGRAEAGTVLVVDDSYQLLGLTISNPRSGEQLNVTSSSLRCDEAPELAITGCFASLNVVGDGFYRATYIVDATVATDAPGSINAFATVSNYSSSANVLLNMDQELLTVATTPTVTVSKTTTSVTNAQVIYKIDISGSAVAGTTVFLKDTLPAGLTFDSEASAGVSYNIDVGANQGDPVDLNFPMTVYASGEFFAIITLVTSVDSSVIPGTVLDDNIACVDVADGPQGICSDPAPATIPLTAPTVTKTTTDVTTETVTYAMTVEGSAVAGTSLLLGDTLPAGLTLSGVTDSSSNVMVGDNTGDPSVVMVPLTVVADGPFSTTVTLMTDVAGDLVPGTVLDTNTACVDVTGGPQDTCSEPASAAVPLTAPTVTKSVTGTEPRPGDAVTWEVAISGTSVAGTGIVLTDDIPAELTLTGVTTTASDNVTTGSNTGGSGAVELPMTVDADGSWSATVEIATTLNSGVAADTVVQNTACVDLVDGPQDTCASAAVTTLRAYTWLELLLLQIVALIVMIVTEAVP